MRRREHQSGFSTTVILLLVLVVTALAATGLVVYQHHKPSSTNNSAATSTTQTTTHPQDTTTTQPAQTTTQYLDIKEWGVRLTLNSDTASLYYYISPQLPDVAYLSLKTVSDVAPNCAADKTSLGAISRLTPAEQQAAPNAAHTAPGTIQIGNYWYGYEGSHADCTDGTATMQAAVSKAAPNLNASTLANTFKTLQATPTTN